jgi:PKD repeat protein
MKNTISCLNSFSSLLFVFWFNQLYAQTGCQAVYTYTHQANNMVVDFTDASTSPNQISNWVWDFGNSKASFDRNPSHDFGTFGIFKVCLTIEDILNCKNTTCQYIKINPPCNADFSILVTGHEIYVVNFSTGATSNTVFNWDFGDLYNSANPNTPHKYLKPGTYTVCLTMDDPNGCHSTICKQVFVRSQCIAGFGYVSDTATNTYSFTNLSKFSFPNTMYYWDFGDGNTSTEENPTHKYLQSGKYNVCLNVIDTAMVCESNYCQEVNFLRKTTKVNSLAGESSILTDLKKSDLVNNEYNITINPNPFYSTATIEYELAEDTKVSIGVYDFTGNCKELILDENQIQGRYTQKIHSDNLHSGVYLVKITIGDKQFTRNISVLKN